MHHGGIVVHGIGMCVCVCNVSGGLGPDGMNG